LKLFTSKRIEERNQGLKILKDAFESFEKLKIIHYSCESFITSHGKTPRVTAICIKDISSGQVTSFSIHLQSQFQGYDFTNLTDKQYDEVEKNMLNTFSNFIKDNSKAIWIHWNMRDSNYGFEAISNRIRILFGKQFRIDNENKIDLPQVLGKIYTFGYEQNRPKGRLLNLAKRNNISDINALTGKEEADAFDNKEYLKLHMSTLRKVDIINTIVSKCEERSLKVKPKMKEIYGLSAAGILEIVRRSPWIVLILSILGYIIGSALEPLVQNTFGTGN
jgi:hypothetical protein